jgi:hypothetical protein
VLKKINLPLRHEDTKAALSIEYKFNNLCVSWSLGAFVAEMNNLCVPWCLGAFVAEMNNLCVSWCLGAFVAEKRIIGEDL